MIQHRGHVCHFLHDQWIADQKTMNIMTPVSPSPLRTTSSSSAKVRAPLVALASSAISGWPTAALSAARTRLERLGRYQAEPFHLDSSGGHNSVFRLGTRSF